MGFAIDLWKIVLESDCSEETENKIRIGLDDLNAKAKAFDEILNIDNQATDEDRITGQYESDIETVISDYKERVDDER